MAENDRLRAKDEAGKRVKSIIDNSAPSPIPLGRMPLNRYYRSLSEMYRIAGVYMAENNYESALTLLVRFASLLLEHIPKHPEYATFNSDEKAKVHKLLPSALESAELMKKKLKLRYEKEILEELRVAAEMEVVLREQIKHRRQEEQQSVHHHPSTYAPSTAAAQIPISDCDVHSINFPDLQVSSSAIVTNQSSSTIIQNRIAPPQIDRATKPIDNNTDGLKTVIIAAGLVGEFLARAQMNTMRSIETCAILCGKLNRNQLTVTHAVIPKQNGGSDSCDTEKEEEVFAFQDAHSMVTVGWIHTHPSQTAFLSSVDLHTHCSYQLMMPEAVAIVCSPKYNETGLFRLSDVGMVEISNCHQTGFHPHEVSSLFESCRHATFSDALIGTVVDLR